MTNNNLPIGILDSGMGGLSIWKEVAKQLPHESILYLADTKRCPYGSRPKDEITTFARQLVAFLVKRGVKLIVVGCNTITVTALDQLRHEFPTIPLVGTVPVIKTAVERTAGPIGILSTQATAKSMYQKELIQQFAAGRQVVSIGTDLLVPFVESGIVGGKELEAVLKEVLAPFKAAHAEAIALGCSHFPFLKEAIQSELGENVHILDSGAAIARQVQRVLTANNGLSDTAASYRFYTTGHAQLFREVGEKLITDGAMKKESVEAVTV